MSIQQWDDGILVVRLTDDPQMADVMDDLDRRLRDGDCDVAVDLSELGLLASSGIARLLRLRKGQLEHGRRLILVSPTDRVWGVFLATGLDQIFEFTESMAGALATLRSNRP